MNSGLIFLSAFVVLFLLVLEGFFSGTEIAILSLSPVKAQKDPKVSFFIQNTDKLLATTLLGTNLCVIANSSYLTYILKKFYGIHNELFIVAILSPLVLIFGETIPKTIAKNRPEMVATVNAKPFSIAYKILSPATTLLTFVLKVMGQEGLAREVIIKREDLPSLIDTKETTDIEEEEKKLIASILSLKETRAKEIMKPIIHVRTLEAHHTVKMAIDTFHQTGYTRLPVYEEHIYNIKGMVTVFDVMDAPLDHEISRYTKRALFVPEVESVWSILKQMQSLKTTIAIVVDEYGAATGLITIEDITEELVGEIEDEYDLYRSPENIIREKDGSYIVSGDISIDTFSALTGIDLPKEETYETLSGLVMFKLDRMPQKGDRIFLNDTEIVVLEADEKKIHRLEIRRWKKN